jgi:hypothetical protein
MREIIQMMKNDRTFFLFLAAIPSEFTDCFGPYSPDAAAAAAMHYQFSGGYPTAPHGKIKTKKKRILINNYF